MTVTTDLAAPAPPEEPPGPPRLDIGDSLRFGWVSFWSHAGPLLLFAVLFVAVCAGIAVAALVIAHALVSWLLAVAIAAIAWAVSLLLALGWLRIGLVVARDGTPRLTDLFNLRGYQSYVWASVVVIASVCVGTALFVIPGLVVATLFCFYGLVVAERGDIGVFESIDWSIAITRGNRWRVFGLIVLLTLINLVGLALAGIGLLFTMGITVLAFARAYTTLAEATERDLSPDTTVARNVGENRIVRFVAITLAVAAFGYYVPQWAWDWSMPGGTLVYGVIVGSLTALMAFGLALVYKSNRVINFAQADLGAVPASFLISLITLEGWSFWIALPAALIASVVLGSFIEFVIIRRFSRAPRLILMVVTIGIAQLLANLGIALQFFMGADLPQQTFSPPFDFSFEIPPQIFHANELIAVITTLLAIVGLWSFLRFTSIGIALRASSESSDRASLLGVNVGLTHNIAWIIATVLATVSLILRAGIIGLPLGPAFGPQTLLRALTAAVIGRFENFTAIFLASCGLGAVEQIVYWNKGSPDLVDPIMFVIVIAALLLQQRNKESRVEDQAISSWQNAANVRPIPRELLALPEVKWTLRALRVAFVGFLVLLPFLLSEKDTNLAAAVAIYAMVAISLVLLTGWAGEISLGQVAFVAIGAAAAGAANVHWHLDPLLSFLLAAGVGAIASVIIGLPALRIRGIFLAITTLAFAVMTSSYLLNRDQSFLGINFSYLPDELDHVTRFPQWTPFGHIGIGDSGAHTERSFYFMCIFCLLLVIVAVRGLQRSRTVRDLVAQRDNERNAQAFRLSPTKVKLLAFALSGFIASFAGGVLVLHQQALGQDIFAPIESIRVLTMVVVGGLGSIPGAILGAVFIKATEWFNVIVPLRFRSLFTFAGSGVGLILVLWLLPGGLGSVLYRVRDMWLRAVARRRNIVVPSLVADTGDDPELLTGKAKPAVAVAMDGDADTRHGPRFLKRFPARSVPDVDYFSYPDLRLSGGTPNLLSLRSVDVAYGQVQVLFGVSLELRRGETIALLGTNGAGKSTVLRAISGLVAPKRGSISHEGVDISGMAPHMIALKGVIQVPGGRGVFPSLTVAENLKVALWMHRRDREYAKTATEQALDLFPALRSRLADPAAQLSGGQQQMLALAMAFLAKPDILMIDELSLGLAPLVVEQLLKVVEQFRDQGVTVILVEQSVNVALTTADKAFFMEKGAIRFHGLTAELLERPDLLRSIFLEGAAAADGDGDGEPGEQEAAEEPEERAVPLAMVQNREVEVVGSNGDRRVMLETRNVTRRFSGITAVDDVSIKLHEGEIVGIVGPNGAGKTTLFDLISGFIVPDSGSIIFDGIDVTRRRPQNRAKLGLARSFQDARLFSGLTVHQALCVALDRPIRSWDPIPAMLYFPNVVLAERRLGKRADELVSMMGLDDYRDKFVSDLSTGSRRIVDLACQIGIEPKVILFDEPSSGIAQRETEALGPLLLRIRDITGASILLIEHDMPLVSGVSDRIIACDLGRVVIEGDWETVRNDPHVVASYLGSTREVIERSGPARPEEVVGGSRP
ncbi:MAG TPA: ATP-binding cassette domain-containing protein [Acidimicrobiia bacterium]